MSKKLNVNLHCGSTPYPEHLIGDDVVLIHDTDLPPEPPIHPSPENDLHILGLFLLALTVVTGLVALFTAMFYGLTLLF